MRKKLFIVPLLCLFVGFALHADRVDDVLGAVSGELRDLDRSLGLMLKIRDDYKTEPQKEQFEDLKRQISFYMQRNPSVVSPNNQNLLRELEGRKASVSIPGVSSKQLEFLGAMMPQLMQPIPEDEWEGLAIDALEALVGKSTTPRLETRSGVEYLAFEYKNDDFYVKIPIAEFAPVFIDDRGDLFDSEVYLEEGEVGIIQAIVDELKKPLVKLAPPPAAEPVPVKIVLRSPLPTFPADGDVQDVGDVLDLLGLAEDDVIELERGFVKRFFKGPKGIERKDEYQGVVRFLTGAVIGSNLLIKYSLHEKYDIPPGSERFVDDEIIADLANLCLRLSKIVGKSDDMQVNKNFAALVSELHGENVLGTLVWRSNGFPTKVRSEVEKVQIKSEHVAGEVVGRGLRAIKRRLTFNKKVRGSVELNKKIRQKGARQLKEYLDTKTRKKKWDKEKEEEIYVWKKLSPAMLQFLAQTFIAAFKTIQSLFPEPDFFNFSRSDEYLSFMGSLRALFNRPDIMFGIDSSLRGTFWKRLYEVGEHSYQGKAPSKSFRIFRDAYESGFKKKNIEKTREVIRLGREGWSGAKMSLGFIAGMNLSVDEIAQSSAARFRSGLKSLTRLVWAVAKDFESGKPVFHGAVELIGDLLLLAERKLAWTGEVSRDPWMRNCYRDFAKTLNFISGQFGTWQPEEIRKLETGLDVLFMQLPSKAKKLLNGPRIADAALRANVATIPVFTFNQLFPQGLPEYGRVLEPDELQLQGLETRWKEVLEQLRQALGVVYGRLGYIIPGSDTAHHVEVAQDLVSAYIGFRNELSVEERRSLLLYASGNVAGEMGVIIPRSRHFAFCREAETGSANIRWDLRAILGLAPLSLSLQRRFDFKVLWFQLHRPESIRRTELLKSFRDIMVSAPSPTLRAAWQAFDGAVHRPREGEKEFLSRRADLGVELYKLVSTATVHSQVEGPLSVAEEILYAKPDKDQYLRALESLNLAIQRANERKVEDSTIIFRIGETCWRAKERLAWTKGAGKFYLTDADCYDAFALIVVTLQEKTVANPVRTHVYMRFSRDVRERLDSSLTNAFVKIGRVYGHGVAAIRRRMSFVSSAVQDGGAAIRRLGATQCLRYLRINHLRVLPNPGKVWVRFEPWEVEELGRAFIGALDALPVGSDLFGQFAQAREQYVELRSAILEMLERVDLMSAMRPEMRAEILNKLQKYSKDKFGMHAVIKASGEDASGKAKDYEAEFFKHFASSYEEMISDRASVEKIISSATKHANSGVSLSDFIVPGLRTFAPESKHWRPALPRVVSVIRDINKQMQSSALDVLPVADGFSSLVGALLERIDQNTVSSGDNMQYFNEVIKFFNWVHFGSAEDQKRIPTNQVTPLFKKLDESSKATLQRRLAIVDRLDKNEKDTKSDKTSLLAARFYRDGEITGFSSGGEADIESREARFALHDAKALLEKVEDDPVKYVEAVNKFVEFVQQIERATMLLSDEDFMDYRLDDMAVQEVSYLCEEFDQKLLWLPAPGGIDDVRAYDSFVRLVDTLRGAVPSTKRSYDSLTVPGPADIPAVESAVFVRVSRTLRKRLAEHANNKARDVVLDQRNIEVQKIETHDQPSLGQIAALAKFEMQDSYVLSREVRMHGMTRLKEYLGRKLEGDGRWKAFENNEANDVLTILIDSLDVLEPGINLFGFMLSRLFGRLRLSGGMGGFRVLEWLDQDGAEFQMKSLSAAAGRATSEIPPDVLPLNECLVEVLRRVDLMGEASTAVRNKIWESLKKGLLSKFGAGVLDPPYKELKGQIEFFDLFKQTYENALTHVSTGGVIAACQKFPSDAFKWVGMGSLLPLGVTLFSAGSFNRISSVGQTVMNEISRLITQVAFQMGARNAGIANVPEVFNGLLLLIQEVLKKTRQIRVDLPHGVETGDVGRYTLGALGICDYVLQEYSDAFDWKLLGGFVAAGMQSLRQKFSNEVLMDLRSFVADSLMKRTVVGGVSIYHSEDTVCPPGAGGLREELSQFYEYLVTKDNFGALPEGAPVIVGKELAGWQDGYNSFPIPSRAKPHQVATNYQVQQLQGLSDGGKIYHSGIYAALHASHLLAIPFRWRDLLRGEITNSFSEDASLPLINNESLLPGGNVASRFLPGLLDKERYCVLGDCGVPVEALIRGDASKVIPSLKDVIKRFRAENPDGAVVLLKDFKQRWYAVKLTPPTDEEPLRVTVVSSAAENYRDTNVHWEIPALVWLFSDSTIDGVSLAGWAPADLSDVSQIPLRGISSIGLVGSGFGSNQEGVQSFPVPSPKILTDIAVSYKVRQWPGLSDRGAAYHSGLFALFHARGLFSEGRDAREKERGVVKAGWNANQFHEKFDVGAKFECQSADHIQRLAGEKLDVWSPAVIENVGKTVNEFLHLGVVSGLYRAIKDSIQRFRETGSEVVVLKSSDSSRWYAVNLSRANPKRQDFYILAEVVASDDSDYRDTEKHWEIPALVWLFDQAPIPMLLINQLKEMLGLLRDMGNWRKRREVLGRGKIDDNTKKNDFARLVATPFKRYGISIASESVLTLIKDELLIEEADRKTWNRLIVLLRLRIIDVVSFEMLPFVFEWLHHARTLPKGYPGFIDQVSKSKILGAIELSVETWDFFLNVIEKKFAEILSSVSKNVGPNNWLEELPSLDDSKWEVNLENAEANCEKILAFIQNFVKKMLLVDPSEIGILPPAKKIKNNIYLSAALSLLKSIRDQFMPFGLANINVDDWIAEYEKQLESVAAPDADQEDLPPAHPAPTVPPAEKAKAAFEALVAVNGATLLMSPPISMNGDVQFMPGEIMYRVRPAEDLETVKTSAVSGFREGDESGWFDSGYAAATDALKAFMSGPIGKPSGISLWTQWLARNTLNNLAWSGRGPAPAVQHFLEKISPARVEFEAMKFESADGTAFYVESAVKENSVVWFQKPDAKFVQTTSRVASDQVGTLQDKIDALRKPAAGPPPPPVSPRLDVFARSAVSELIGDRLQINTGYSLEDTALPVPVSKTEECLQFSHGGRDFYIQTPVQENSVVWIKHAGVVKVSGVKVARNQVAGLNAKVEALQKLAAPQPPPVDVVPPSEEPPAEEPPPPVERGMTFAAAQKLCTDLYGQLGQAFAKTGGGRIPYPARGTLTFMQDMVGAMKQILPGGDSVRKKAKRASIMQWVCDEIQRRKWSDLAPFSKKNNGGLDAALATFEYLEKVQGAALAKAPDGFWPEFNKLRLARIPLSNGFRSAGPVENNLEEIKGNYRIRTPYRLKQLKGLKQTTGAHCGLFALYHSLILLGQPVGGGRNDNAKVTSKVGELINSVDGEFIKSRILERAGIKPLYDGGQLSLFRFWKNAIQNYIGHNDGVLLSEMLCASKQAFDKGLPVAFVVNTYQGGGAQIDGRYGHWYALRIEENRLGGIDVTILNSTDGSYVSKEAIKNHGEIPALVYAFTEIDTKKLEPSAVVIAPANIQLAKSAIERVESPPAMVNSAMRAFDVEVAVEAEKSWLKFVHSSRKYRVQLQGAVDQKAVVSAMVEIFGEAAFIPSGYRLTRDISASAAVALFSDWENKVVLPMANAAKAALIAKTTVGVLEDSNLRFVSDGITYVIKTDELIALRNEYNVYIKLGQEAPEGQEDLTFLRATGVVLSEDEKIGVMPSE